MMMADGTTQNFLDFGGVDVDVTADDDDDMCIDMDSLLGMLDDSPPDEYSSQKGVVDPSLSLAPYSDSASRVGNNEHPQFDNGSFRFSPSDHSEVSASRTVCSSGSPDSERQAVNFCFEEVERRPEVASSMHLSSGSPSGWEIPVPGHGAPCLANYGVSLDLSSSSQHAGEETKFEIANSNRRFGFSDGNGSHQLMEKSGMTDGMNCESVADSCRTSEPCGNIGVPLMDFGLSDLIYDRDGEFSLPYSMNINEPSYFVPSRECEASGIHPLTHNDGAPFNVKTEFDEQFMCNGSLNSSMNYETQAGRAGRVAMVDQDVNIGLYASASCSNTCLPSSESSSDTLAKESMRGNTLPHMFNMLNKKEEIFVKDEKSHAPFAAPGARGSFKAVDDMGFRKSRGFAERMCADNGVQSFYCVPKEELVNVEDAYRSNTPLSNDRPMDVRLPGKPFPHSGTSIQKELICAKEERETKFAALGSISSSPLKNGQQAVQSAHVTYVDDDPDICIIEEMSEPARKKQSPVDAKPLLTVQRSSLAAPLTHMGYASARLKANDERFVYRVALQDLSQPKLEASPPDGSLAVPLLRHQRIALSWMVQKETKATHCCGGILADDQGLGKTISIIALILKERSPPSGACTIEKKLEETETLNLDEDDDDNTVIEIDKSELNAESCSMTTDGSSTERGKTSVPSQSRPAAGTLVVCPTSVLRQWNEELHNKVRSEANLSVLVYHGGNRTKDPLELAKYDVVLTTYAIVSMEVPKQPLVDEDEDETKKRSDFLPVGVSSSKKRKYPPSSGKSSKKGKRGIDSELFESLARPLAKVRWFRVVLDEAQSIKNYRTQVARACWGLRAKRRWCLSGTPIQNAIDDLYSYFRFLKYDPYCVYRSFCSTIKVPIQRNPGNGYRKLQALLKTVMLRRTKGTLLDGEPIISLPPKSVKLKKVEFTSEERDFYCRLEADSRAQFEEFAAAGTVKQNYVNILLMLLRLRQACDHPLLVRGSGSNSEWKSSVEKAKKLPQEKRSRLLNCLEASLAICGICNDPPEDAVVTTCEHVFCNQCILELLSSDDSQCPSSKCKALLSTSSVFSKSTLRMSMGDQAGVGSTVDSSGTVNSEVLGPCSSSGLVNSSKIDASEALDSSKLKAALEVLHNISRPQGINVDTGSCSSLGGCASSPEKSSNDFSGDFHKDTNVNGNSVVREKAIVFSQWTRMLDLLEACLKDSSISYRRLDGTMSVAARDKAVKDFNTLPEVTVMIMSLKAASLGLNMVAACHVLLLDLWWNPTTEDQAIDRAHRIGQTRPVSVLRLTVKDTVEDRILALQQKKREMVSSAFGEDETGSRQTRLTVDDLKYLFQVQD